jgi:chromosome segregation ATPase
MDPEALRMEIIEQVQTTFESQMRELRRQKNDAEEELDSASERWRLERRRLKAEIDELDERLRNARSPLRNAADAAEWEAEREELKSQISGLETSLRETAAKLDQLRLEYETKLDELASQNARLRQELGGASLVAATEVRLEPPVDHASVDSVDDEMRRVEGLIYAIETLLEEPDTTASTRARKNIERAENEAYLRGLNFRFARRKGA